MVLVSGAGSARGRGACGLLLLVVLSAFAGCVDDPDGGTGTDPTERPSGGTGPKGEVLAPTWSIGDHWTFEGADGGSTTFVVIEDTGTDWIIGTDSQELSFFHAQEEVSNLGAQRKSDLAGSQGSDRIAYFQWPLVDGASWNTTWDGVARRITTTKEADTWSFEAHEEDRLAVRYTYDPAVRWFKTLEFLAPDGSSQFAWTLKGSGSNWTGEVFQWDLERIVSIAESNVAFYNPSPQRFEVSASATDVWLALEIECTMGTVVGGVHPLDDPAAGQRWNEACQDDVSYRGSLGHKAGTWSFDLIWQDTTPGPVSGVLYVRTLERVVVG